MFAILLSTVTDLGYSESARTVLIEKIWVWGVLLISLGGFAALILAVQDWKRSRLTLKAIQQLETPATAKLVDQEIARLREKDPDFNLSLFEVRARELFLRTMAARAEGKLPERHEVSDGVFRRELVVREQEQEHGLRLVHSKIELLEVRTIGAFHDPFFDTLHIRFFWRSRVTEVAIGSKVADAKVLERKPEERLHTMVWAFVRRPATKTKKKLAAGACPNCGAPFSGGATNLCSHCNAVVNSGEFDWVLTQELSFAAYRGPWREFTGLAEMNARDPGFSPEVMEDRAALIFWKWLLARSLRQPEMLARLCTPEMLVQAKNEAEEHRRRKQRRWTWDVRVEGVDLVLIEHDNDEDRDEVCLRVRWTGKCADFPETARPLVQSGSYSSVLTLVRESGVTTDVRTGVSSDRCHNCRAANSDSEAATCSFCGAPFEPGKHDFVLANVSNWEVWLAARRYRAAEAKAVEPYLPSFKFVDERRRLLQMMVAIARTDGEVDSSERALLKLCSSRWGVPFKEIREMLEAKTPPPPPDLEPDSWVARAFLEAVISMAAIDGSIDTKERSLIGNLARRLKVEMPSRAELDARAAKARATRRELEREA